MKTLEDIEKEMKRHGYADLGTCYLEPREVVMQEQMEWAENDGCKGFDFSVSAYWLPRNRKGSLKVPSPSRMRSPIWRPAKTTLYWSTKVFRKLKK